jgi:hypothetical protein
MQGTLMFFWNATKCHFWNTDVMFILSTRTCCVKSNSSVPNYGCQTIELLNPIPTLLPTVSSASDPSVNLFLFGYQEG